VVERPCETNDWEWIVLMGSGVHGLGGKGRGGKDRARVVEGWMDPFVVELPFWRNDWEWIMLMGSGVCVWWGGV
jgi:hypothetical protein